MVEQDGLMMVTLSNVGTGWSDDGALSGCGPRRSDGGNVII